VRALAGRDLPEDLADEAGVDLDLWRAEVALLPAGGSVSRLVVSELRLLLAELRQRPEAQDAELRAVVAEASVILAEGAGG
jgi:hypothetical protein